MKLPIQIAILASFFFGASEAAHGLAGHRIINGVEVPAGAFPEVLRVRVENAGCTATLVGPRAILTAGHCARDGATLQFTAGGEEYTAKVFRHPEYVSNDRDVALAISPRIVAGIRPMKLGSDVKVGDPIFLLGYGCTEPGGGGGNDGKLRIGESSVKGFTGNDFISTKEDGGAVCFGDSGGPAYRYIEGKYEMAGINSKGNILDTNYSANLSLPENEKFLLSVAKHHGVEICGLTSDCLEEQGPAPQFKDRVMNISISAGMAFSHNLVSLLETPLNDVIWSLDAEAPNWMVIRKDILSIFPTHDATGTFLLSLTAKNSEGADAMLIRVTIVGSTVPRPTCTLTATPSFVKLGEILVVTMKTQGQVTSAAIDGHDMEAGESLIIDPAAVGVFVVKGQVEGPGGVGTCVTRYAVK